jgi:hypothetical protein
VLTLAVTVSVWAEGAVPPAGAVNRRLEGATVSDGVTVAAETTSVTDTVRTPDAAVINTEPLHVLPAAIPDGSVETVKVVAVGPVVKLPAGEIDSQLLRPQLCLVTCTDALVVKSAVTESVCPGGADPPETALKVNAVGLTVKGAEGTAITFRVTGMVCVPVGAVTCTTPWQTLPVVSPVWSTEMVKTVAVGPAVKEPVGESFSQVRVPQVCSDT